MTPTHRWDGLFGAGLTWLGIWSMRRVVFDEPHVCLLEFGDKIVLRHELNVANLPFGDVAK